MKKSLIVGILVVVLLITMNFLGCKAGVKTEKSGVTIGVIYLTLEHPYYQAHQKHTQNYAKELGISLVEMDGKIDASVMADQMENLIAQKVDGIIFCLIDPAAAVPSINEAQKNGIPVITFAIKHGEGAKCPFVGVDEYAAAYDAGVEAAKWVKDKRPEWSPKLGIIDMPEAEAPHMRAVGFKEGFLSVTPGAEILAEVNGKGVRDEAMTVTEDMLEAHPEINVIYGINGDSILGAMAALEASGRGTIETELCVGHDGTEPEIIYLVTPDSSLKIDVANTPKEFARMCVDVLMEIINGKRDMYNTDEVLAKAKVLLPDDIEYLQKFLKDEYFSELDLSQYAK